MKWPERAMETTTILADAPNVQNVDVRRGRPRRDEGGTAMLEFAIVATLLLSLVIGIIAFGLLMQRKQQDVQAAAEGTRAGVATPYSSQEMASYLLGGPEPNPVLAARAAVNRAMADTNRVCQQGDTDTAEASAFSADGLRCPITVSACPVGADVRYCIKVQVIDENQGNFRVVPQLPLLSSAIPGVMRATSVAELGGLIQ